MAPFHVAVCLICQSIHFHFICLLAVSEEAPERKGNFLRFKKQIIYVSSLNSWLTLTK